MKRVRNFKENIEVNEFELMHVGMFDNTEFVTMKKLKKKTIGYVQVNSEQQGSKKEYSYTFRNY